MPVLPLVGSMMTLPGTSFLRLGAFDHVLRHAVPGAARHVAALELGKDAGVQTVLCS